MSCTFHVSYTIIVLSCVSLWTFPIISNKKGWNYLGYCLDCKASVWKTRTSSDKFKKLPQFTAFVVKLLAAGATCDGPKMSETKLAHDFLSGVMRTSSCQVAESKHMHPHNVQRITQKDTKVGPILASSINRRGLPLATNES